MEPTKFVIYCAPRTGSYHLMSLLDSAPDIICHGELFKPQRIELRPTHKERFAAMPPCRRDAKPMPFLCQVRALDPDRHFGFKLFRQHLGRVKPLRRLLRGGGWKTIALYRDPVEVYASLLRAKETQRWTNRKDDRPDYKSPAVKVHFTPKSFERFARNYGSFVKTIARFSGKPDWLAVRYDQLNDSATQQVMLTFLGSTASPDQLSSDYEKQYDLPITEAFDNWEEFTGHIRRNDAYHNLMRTIEGITAPEGSRFRVGRNVVGEAN